MNKAIVFFLFLISSALIFATDLTDAIKSGDYELVEMLLENGANPNEADDDGNMPLTIAILNQDYPVIYSLLIHGGTEVAERTSFNDRDAQLAWDFAFVFSADKSTIKEMYSDKGRIRMPSIELWPYEDALIPFSYSRFIFRPFTVYDNEDTRFTIFSFPSCTDMVIWKSENGSGWQIIVNEKALEGLPVEVRMLDKETGDIWGCTVTIPCSYPEEYKGASSAIGSNKKIAFGALTETDIYLVYPDRRNVDDVEGCITTVRKTDSGYELVYYAFPYFRKYFDAEIVLESAEAKVGEYRTQLFTWNPNGKYESPSIVIKDFEVVE